MVFQTEKALKEVGDKVSESDRAAVQADIDALKNALGQLPADGSLSDDQIANIKSLREKLMNSSQSVFTKMYEQAQQANAGAQGAAGQNMGGSQSAPHDDNVVDGDFREV